MEKLLKEEIKVIFPRIKVSEKGETLKCEKKKSFRKKLESFI